MSDFVDIKCSKNLNVRLYFIRKCSIVSNIGNKESRCECVPSTLIANQELGGEAMVEIILFLVIGFMISLTTNLALLCVIYIQWVNNQIK